MTSTQNTPSLAALNEQRRVVSGLEQQSEDHAATVARFNAAAAGPHPAIEARDRIKAERAALLARVAMSEVLPEAIDQIDAALSAAELLAAEAARSVEVAQAGAAHVTKLHQAVAHRLSLELPKVAALAYAAGVEQATARLADYHAAAEAFGKAHAALLGACLAVDEYADVRATPARLFVRGSHMATEWEPVLPALPIEKPEAWRFNIMADVLAAHAAAAKALA